MISTEGSLLESGLSLIEVRESFKENIGHGEARMKELSMEGKIMEPIHPKYSGTPNIQPEAASKKRSEEAADQKKTTVNIVNSDTVEISKEAEIKNAERASNSVEEQVANQNRLAQESAAQVQGLGYLGVHVQVTDQNTRLGALLDGL